MTTQLAKQDMEVSGGMVEEWRIIKEFPDHEVSNLGQLRGPNGLRKYGVVRDHCMVPIIKNGKQKCPYLHRLVAKAFLPNPLELPQVNHIDGNPLNNCVDNLEWCTSSHNCKHAYSLGLRTAANMKLTLESAREIKRRLANKETMPSLAKLFGISRSAVQQIKLGNNWKEA